ncbi:Thoeris anti-defense Tad2 family protein [Massilia sp. TSP1-1-2]|uniref:Thoeris anti-defense Tad2 family protein n=1 Tax=Massilia sp. TSP1-1-2 TaxID=2804649 RepID=UPI003CF42093
MKYIHHTNGVQIDANQITGVSKRRSRATPGFLLRLASGADFLASSDITAGVIPSAGDYLAHYEGRPVIVQQAPFEQNYSPAGGLCFGRALMRLKLGERIARTSWEADSFICLGAAHPGLEAEKIWNQHARAMAEANGGTAPVHQYFIHAEGGQIQMGWAPSQTETLAEDWHVV